jgi:uncharacterized protein YejL (UPF0352 family)
MNIDKTDFINLLEEAGSEISTPSSSFKGIFVPLQATKQLLDVILKPGDAVVYTDPAEILTLGELFSFQGKSFLLVSNSKIQYINGNPIYMELGLERFLPSLNFQSSYDIRTCISLSLSSLYNINQTLFSKSIPSSYDISAPILISASLLFPSLYNINQNLFSKSIPSSYDIPIPVSTSFSLSSLYNITQNLFSKSIPSSYDIPIPVSTSFSLSSLYNITQNLFSKSIPSSYDIPIPVSTSFSLSSLYNINQNLFSKSISSSYDISAPTLVSASLLFPSLYNINQNLFSKSIPSSYDLPTPVSTSFSLSSLYNITQNLFSKSIPSSYDLQVAPAQVTGLRAEADEGRNIRTFWIPIEDEDLDYYKVHRSTVSDFAPSDANLVGVPKTNQFTHKNLDSVTKYYVKVCAVNKQGDSGSYSTQAYATTVE